MEREPSLDSVGRKELTLRRVTVSGLKQRAKRTVKPIPAGQRQELACFWEGRESGSTYLESAGPVPRIWDKDKQ